MTAKFEDIIAGIAPTKPLKKAVSTPVPYVTRRCAECFTSVF